MRQVTLETGISLDWAYTSSEWQFGVVKGGSISTGFLEKEECTHTCRESVIYTLTDMIRDRKRYNPKKTILTMYHLTGGLVISRSGRRGGTIAKNTDALIEKWTAHAKNGVALVNSLEKNAGLPLTKLYKVKPLGVGGGVKKTYDRRHVWFAVIGSRKWIHSPVMLSAYMSMLRAGPYASLRNMGTLAAYKKTFHEIREKAIGKKTSGDYCSSYFYMVLKHILPVLENFDILFKGRSLMRNWDPARLRNGDRCMGDYGVEGFHRMADGSSKDLELAERFEQHILKKRN